MDPRTLDSLLAQSWEDLAAFLPVLGVACILLLMGFLIGRLFSVLIRRLLRRLGLDTLAERAGVGAGLRQVGIDKTVSDLLGIVVFWLIFLSSVLIAFDQLGLDAMVVPLQGFLGYLPQLLAAALVFVLGAFMAQFLGRAVQGAAAGLGLEFHQTLGVVVRGLFFVITLLVVSEQLGLDVSLLTNSLINVLTILAAGLALTFALGAQNFVKNILAGYYAREMYSLGDHVRIGEVEGRLEAIGPLNAEIAVIHDRLIVPNTRLVEDLVWFRKTTEHVE